MTWHLWWTGDCVYAAWHRRFSEDCGYAVWHRRITEDYVYATWHSRWTKNYVCVVWHCRFSEVYDYAVRGRVVTFTVDVRLWLCRVTPAVLGRLWLGSEGRRAPTFCPH